MSYEEKLMLKRMLDIYTTDEVKDALKRYTEMNMIDQDEANGRC